MRVLGVCSLRPKLTRLMFSFPSVWKRANEFVSRKVMMWAYLPIGNLGMSCWKTLRDVKLFKNMIDLLLHFFSDLGDGFWFCVLFLFLDALCGAQVGIIGFAAILETVDAAT